MTPRIIVSCADASEGLLAAELSSPPWRLGAPVWLAPGVGVIDADGAWEALHSVRPVFLRHMFPAIIEVDRAALYPSAIDGVISRLQAGRPVSVQARGPARGELAAAIGEMIVAVSGASVDVQSTDQVVSVVDIGGRLYLGVSSAAANLSAWPGGEHRFRREDARISRSEFKLLEALDAFQLRFPEAGLAVDLGAAPGGWTRILRSRGLRVVSVDPADLDPSVARDPAVDHRRTTAERYLPSAPPHDVIVNDIRADARVSVGLMQRAAPLLRAGGCGLVTLKLPETATSRAVLRLVAECVERLASAYRIAGVRQLFHNRSEVSVALQPAVVV